jgi:hypothetical protein
VRSRLFLKMKGAALFFIKKLKVEEGMPIINILNSIK